MCLLVCTASKREAVSTELVESADVRTKVTKLYTNVRAFYIACLYSLLEISLYVLFTGLVDLNVMNKIDDLNCMIKYLHFNLVIKSLHRTVNVIGPEVLFKTCVSLKFVDDDDDDELDRPKQSVEVKPKTYLSFANWRPAQILNQK